MSRTHRHQVGQPAQYTPDDAHAVTPLAAVLTAVCPDGTADLLYWDRDRKAWSGASAVPHASAVTGAAPRGFFACPGEAESV